METNDDSLERFLRAQLWDYEIYLGIEERKC